MKQLNHREKKKKIATIAITALFIMIISISIAYAALSRTLTISGSSQVKANNWGVAIRYSDGTKSGDASFTTPVVNGTSISYSVNLKKPSDQVVLNFTADNQGTLNAELASIISSTPTCTSSTGNTADANLVCNNLEISIKYSENVELTPGDVLNKDDHVCKNGTNYSYSDESIYIKVIIRLKDSMTAVPSSNVTVSNIKHDFVYTQTSKYCETRATCFVAGTKVLTENGYTNIEDIIRTFAKMY